MDSAYELAVLHDGYVVYPVVLSSVTLENDRFMTPGKLSFSVATAPELVMSEGDEVKFSVMGTVMFVGRIFKQSYSDDTIKVTAYDQRRY
ncbi:MAG: hypothetical protein ACK5L0_09665 [Candidatus Fimivivens sp.]